MSSVLVLGSGGREHALARALAADPVVSTVHVAPGNPGSWRFATRHDVDLLDPAAVARLARETGADLVVVGPEAPLVAGVADAVRAAGTACFGASAAAARLEGSKQFAKEVMAAAGVPTAGWRWCTSPEEVAVALDDFGAPYVVKADGLMAGKGVVVTGDRQAALDHAAACGEVVVEEYLDGPEVSLFVVTDSVAAVPLLAAQDFKRVGDGDTGANTGGMGAYAPLPWAPAGLTAAVLEQVVHPTLAEMRHRGTPFAGLLYCGLALTSRGLRVVEFNARFGDPETQAVLALLESSLYELLLGAATGTLAEVDPPRWRPGAAVTVVAAAEGYPGQPRTGGAVSGPGLEQDDAQGHLIQAGTALHGDRLVAAGGRVLAAVGLADDLAGARDNAYRLLERTDFSTGFWRTDIAARAAAGEIATPTL